jgi:hypothetical protein
MEEEEGEGRSRDFPTVLQSELSARRGLVLIFPIAWRPSRSVRSVSTDFIEESCCSVTVSDEEED